MPLGTVLMASEGRLDRLLDVRVRHLTIRPDLSAQRLQHHPLLVRQDVTPGLLAITATKASHLATTGPGSFAGQARDCQRPNSCR